MKKIILIFMLVSSSAFAGNNYSDDICIDNSSDITFPAKGDAEHDVNGVCLKGKNITQYITGGGEITSATFNKVADVFYYTVYKGDVGGYDDIDVMSVTYKKGKIYATSLFDTKSVPHSEEPKDSLEGLTVSFYDKRNSTLYLSANAWATSNSVRAIKFSDNYSSKILSQRFFTDGDLHYITDKGLSISQIGHDSKSAYFPAYLYGRDGKVICQLDTRDSLWEVDQPCLDKRVALKER